MNIKIGNRSILHTYYYADEAEVYSFLSIFDFISIYKYDYYAAPNGEVYTGVEIRLGVNGKIVFNFLKKLNIKNYDY